MFSDRVSHLSITPVEEASRIARANPGAVNLASGVPDPATVPLREILLALESVAAELGAGSFSYPGAGGLPSLRREVARLLARIGVPVSWEEVVVTSGAQHGVNLVAELLLRGEDAIAVENPTFVETLQALRYRAGRVVGIPVDERGMVVERLEQLLRRGLRPKLVYTIPLHHNPMGVSMAETRARHLAELAEEYGFWVVEDDPYRLVSPRNQAPVKKFSPSRVFYIGSFSKVLAPGLRLGFVAAPREAAEALELLEQLDFSTSTPWMHVLERLLRSGAVERRRAKLAAHYGGKLRAALDALEDTMPPQVSWTRPDGGLFIMAWLGRDSRALLPRAVEKGVVYVPAQGFYVEDPRRDAARFSVGPEPVERIVDGVRTLARLITDVE